ncbi:MAG: hypothetical protein U9Q71_07625 [Pseudomonadota bacterium]|nr:hypothetical protein [Pseudomonadota bacterium]
MAQAGSSLDAWEETVDFGSPGYAETGNAWRSWPFSPAVGGSYRYLSYYEEGRTRVGAASWSVTIPVDGRYEVLVSFRRTENRTRDADYHIVDGSGVRHDRQLDQHATPTRNDLTWVSLGEYSWKTGQTASVVLDGTDDNQSDEADAARWVLVEDLTPGETPASVIPAVLLLLGQR